MASKLTSWNSIATGVTIFFLVVAFVLMAFYQTTGRSLPQHTIKSINLSRQRSLN